MKILVVAGYSPSLVDFRGDFLAALVAKGHRLYAAGPPAAVRQNLCQELSSVGVEFVPIRLSRAGLSLFADLSTLLELYLLIRRLRPDLVFAYTVKPVVYVGIAATLLRLTCSVRVPRFVALITGVGYAFTGSRASVLRALLRVFLRRLYLIGLRPAESIIFQNPDDQALFCSLKFIPPCCKTYRVWGSGVDLCAFPPQPLPAAPIFLMLARLLVDKGIREYVNAAREVKRIYPNAVFRLAGMLDPNPSAIPQTELDAWIREGAIEYLGALRHVQSSLASCRFYVLPSYREGTPRSVLEALATARPVITTDAPGCRETVIHGLNGHLVPPRNADALAAAMLQMIEQSEAETQSMAKASLALARDRFDVHKVNAQLLDVIGA